MGDAGADRSGDGSTALTSSVPGYAKPSIASRLPQYSNAAAETIRAAFMPSNYRTIGALHTVPPALDGSQAQQPFRVGFAGHSTFSDFAYTCSPYDLHEETRILERKEHEEKMREVGGEQPFFAGYNCFKQHHEMDMGFDYLSEPYEATFDAKERERWLKDSDRNPRPFLPPGGEKALSKPTRALLGEAMTALYRSVSADWEDAKPTVISTAEDLIVMYFPLDKIRSPQGVLTYMNNALRRDESVIAFDLRKVAEGWNITTEDGHLMFTFRPPWVRMRAFLSKSGGDAAPAASSSSPPA